MARSLKLVPFLALALTAPVFGQNAAEQKPFEEDVVIIGGSVRDASDAQTPEDTTLPELPTAQDDGQ
jgi:hypothetical protein